MDDLEEQKPQSRSKKVVIEKPAAWPKYLKSATRFSYFDPESKIRFAPEIPVRVDAEPRKGSWLASQMLAGLIVEA